MNENPFLTNKFDRFMWKITNFLLWRYVRLATLGFSLSASVVVTIAAYYMFKSHDWTFFVFDVVMFLMNTTMLVINAKKYKRDFWND